MSPTASGRIRRLMEGVAKRSRSCDKNAGKHKTVSTNRTSTKRGRTSEAWDINREMNKRKKSLSHCDPVSQEGETHLVGKMEDDASAILCNGVEEEAEEEETDDDDRKTVRTIVKVPTSKDVLIGTGRACSSHPGNSAYQAEIRRLQQTYVDATVKKTVVESVIDFVIKQGGRFLSKSKAHPGAWVVVESKVRLFRNARSCFTSSANRRQGVSATSSLGSDRQKEPTSSSLSASERAMTRDRGESFSMPARKREETQEAAKKTSVVRKKPPKPLATKWGPLEKEIKVDTLIGARVSVIWDVDGIYSLGTIMHKRRQGKKINGNNDKYLVKYDDSEIAEWLDFNKQPFQVIKDAEPGDPRVHGFANGCRKVQDDGELQEHREKVW